MSLCERIEKVPFSGPNVKSNRQLLSSVVCRLSLIISRLLFSCRPSSRIIIIIYLFIYFFFKFHDIFFCRLGKEKEKEKSEEKRFVQQSNDSGGSCCGTWWIEPVHLYSVLGSVREIYLSLQVFLFFYWKCGRGGRGTTGAKRPQTTAECCNHFSGWLRFLCHPPPGRSSECGTECRERFTPVSFLAHRFLHSKRQRQNIFCKCLGTQTFMRFFLFFSFFFRVYYSIQSGQSPVWLTSLRRPKSCYHGRLFLFLFYFSTFFSSLKTTFCQICVLLKRHLKCLNTNRRLFFCFVFCFSKKWEGNQICKASGGFGSSARPVEWTRGKFNDRYPSFPAVTRELKKQKQNKNKKKQPIVWLANVFPCRTAKKTRKMII